MSTREDHVHPMVSTAQIGTVPALVVFAGLAQFIAGLWAFRETNTFAASAFCCYVPGFTLSGLGLIGEPKIIGHAGGYWLIAPAVLAFYLAGALVINSGYRPTVLPLFGKA